MRYEARAATAIALFVVFTGAPADVLAQQETQTTLEPAEAIEHVGEAAVVCGEVVSATYAARSNGQPTFLNLDKPYPNHVFTAVIWGEDRFRFETAPEEAFDEERVCVSGRIETYRGKAQVEVSRPAQIEVR